MTKKINKTGIKKNDKTNTKGRAAVSAAAFEALEDRRLFSVLTFDGSPGNDTFRFTQTGSVLSVNLNGINVSYLANSVDGIVVNGNAGDDRVQTSVMFNKPITVNGGAGNDHMMGGRQNDTFNGGDGNDTMVASIGQDDFTGGAGSDTADYTSYNIPVNVTLDGVANDGRNLEMDNVRADVENVVGGSANDTITGNASANYLQGGGGTDTLRGMEGDDTLDGGVGGAGPYTRNTGNDLLYGGTGNDVLHASDHGNNRMYGEAGNDRLYGYNGADELYAGSGADWAFGGNNSDLIYGGTGDDYLDGQAGVDKVYGNAGPVTTRLINPLPIIRVAGESAEGVGAPIDAIIQPIDPIVLNPVLPIRLIDPIINPVLPPIDIAPRPILRDDLLIDPVIDFGPIFVIETDDDVVHGGDGNDRVRGDGGADLVYGDAGNDVAYGDAGDDTVSGGAGNDSVYGGAGTDQMFGGDGNDVLVSIGGGQADRLRGDLGFDSFWCDSEVSELVLDASASELLEGNCHRVGAFQQLRTSDAANNTLATMTPSRELNGQNLLDPVIKAGGTYQDFSDRPLFGSAGPHKDDVVQGGLANCYYLAGLSAVAKANANRIRQSVVDLGDGTYAVQLFDGASAEFWRVDGELPANGAGNPVYAKLGHQDAVWSAIMEKAFAFSRSNRGTYASTEWGGIDTFEVLNLGNSGIARPNALAAIQNIKARMDAGQAVIAWTPGGDAIPADCPCVGSHMYSVESVALQTINLPFIGEIVVGGTITVRNPWGTDGGGNADGANDGYVTLTADQFFRGFAGAWGANA